MFFFVSLRYLWQSWITCAHAVGFDAGIRIFRCSHAWSSSMKVVFACFRDYSLWTVVIQLCRNCTEWLGEGLRKLRKLRGVQVLEITKFDLKHGGKDRTGDNLTDYYFGCSFFQKKKSSPKKCCCMTWCSCTNQTAKSSNIFGRNRQRIQSYYLCSVALLYKPVIHGCSAKTQNNHDRHNRRAVFLPAIPIIVRPSTRTCARAVREREIDMPNASKSSGERSRLSLDLQKFTSLD